MEKSDPIRGMLQTVEEKQGEDSFCRGPAAGADYEEHPFSGPAAGPTILF
jgi:hypothetical protein